MGRLVRFVLKMMISGGEKVAKELDEATKNPKEAQEAILRQILQKSAKSEFGEAYHFSEINSVEEYEKNVPLTDYEFYSDYIERMVLGEQNILTCEPIVHYNLTSGTTGTPKKIPVTEDHISLFSKYNAKYLNYLASRSVGTAWISGKGLSLSEGTYQILPTGVSIGSASSLHTARTARSMPLFKMDSMDLMYTSPKEARQPSSLGNYTRYLHALFALREENITYGNVTFSSVLLELLRYIELNWEMLCDDIEKGTINPKIEMPEEERKGLNKRMKPLPGRAEQLRRIFKDHLNEPFGKRIWPNLSFFICVGGAGFQSYTDSILARYLGKETHILYLGLTSSEALISMPVQMDSSESVLVPDGIYMEFIPVIDGERDLTNGIKHLWELEKGGQYEVVVTNLSGLYRYQLKDVIEVTGFYNQTPVTRFLSRAGYAINMCAEKTSDSVLRHAIEQTCSDLHLDMYDYCVCPLQDESGSRYVFMYELNKVPEHLSRKELRDTTEKHLMEANLVYSVEVKIGNLQPAEVRLLQRETFMLYRDLMIMKGRSAAQLKPVHVTGNEFQKKFFMGLEDKDVWQEEN